MSERFDEAVAALRAMPPAERDSLVEAILTVARSGTKADIAPEHLPLVLQALAQMTRGEFATEDEVAEAFRTFRP